MTSREKVNLKITEINFPSPPGKPSVCRPSGHQHPPTKYIHKQKVENRKWNKTGANLITVSSLSYLYNCLISSTAFCYSNIITITTNLQHAFDVLL